MSAFLAQLTALNDTVKGTFGTETIQYQQRTLGAAVGAPVPITAIPIDPLRLEGQSNGNFAVRWVQTMDFINWIGELFVPVKGDTVVLADVPTLTVGGLYTVIQVQEDVGGGVRLVLEKRAG